MIIRAVVTRRSNVDCELLSLIPRLPRDKECLPAVLDVAALIRLSSKIFEEYHSVSWDEDNKRR